MSGSVVPAAVGKGPPSTCRPNFSPPCCSQMLLLGFLGPAPLFILPASSHLPGLVLTTPCCRILFPSQKAKDVAPSSTPSFPGGQDHC